MMAQGVIVLGYIGLGVRFFVRLSSSGVIRKFKVDHFSDKFIGIGTLCCLSASGKTGCNE